MWRAKKREAVSKITVRCCDIRDHRVCCVFIGRLAPFLFVVVSSLIVSRNGSARASIWFLCCRFVFGSFVLVSFFVCWFFICFFFYTVDPVFIRSGLSRNVEETFDDFGKWVRWVFLFVIRPYWLISYRVLLDLVGFHWIASRLTGLELIPMTLTGFR